MARKSQESINREIMPTSKQIYKRLIMEQQPTKIWTTEIWAVNHTRYFDPARGFPIKWQGPYVPGTSIEDAQRYCDTNGMGYCRVVGELIEEGEIGVMFDI